MSAENPTEAEKLKAALEITTAAAAAKELLRHALVMVDQVAPLGRSFQRSTNIGIGAACKILTSIVSDCSCGKAGCSNNFTEESVDLIVQHVRNEMEAAENARSESSH